MEKKPLQEVYEMIEVPKEGVLEAIKAGKNRASQDATKNKWIPRKIVWSIVAAATIIVSSSFISPTLSHVLAKVPLLGDLYSAFNDVVGRSLQSQDLITELDHTYSSKGVDVTITSAYFDGAVIGVTFSAKGNIEIEEDGRVQGLYEVFDGKDGFSDSKEIVYMEPTDSGYIGHIRLSYPKIELPPETSFPLEFKSIGEKDGSWRFNVPINQLPYETVTVDKGTNDVEAKINVHFDSIIEGKASTAIDYTATFPIEGKHDQVRLVAYDDHGKEINISNDGIDLEKIEENNKIIVKGRSIIPQSLKGKTSYLEVYPEVALTELDQFIQLNSATPIEIKAARQDFVVKMEKINTKDKTVTYDFQINNGNYMNKHFTFFSNFARNDVTLVKESEKDIYKEAIKHSVEVINKNNLRFRVTFDISKINDFNLNDYVIRINMGSLSSNIPFELDKVKIDLN